MQKYFSSYLLIFLILFSILKPDDKNNFGKYYEMFVESEISRSQLDYRNSNNILFKILDKGVVNQQIYEIIIDNYLMMGDTLEAVHYSNIAIDSFEDKSLFLSIIADYYIKEIDMESMELLLNQNKKLFLEESLIYKKAEMLFMLSDWESLILTYRDIAIKYHSDLDELIDRIIEIGGLTNNFDLLISSLIDISKAYPSHISLKDKIVDINIEIGDYLQAIKYLSDIPYENLTQDNKIILSRLYMMVGDYNSAYQLSKSLYDINIVNFELFEILFISLFNIENDELFPELYSISNKIITHFPESPMGYEALATLYIIDKKYNNALEILFQAIEILDDVEGSFFQLGLVYQSMGNDSKSLESFEKAYNINSKDYSFMSSLAMAYNKNKQYEICDSLYENYILENPIDEALNDYAYLLSERVDIKEEKLLNALEMSFKAVKNNMDNESYLDTIGWIYYKLNNFEKAKYYLEKCVEINDNNIIILEHLGDTYLKLNLLSEASKIYKKAIGIDGNQLELKKKIEQIKR